MNFKEIPIGIDLGTTNSCIGAYRNGSVVIISNQISGKTSPSVVCFGEETISIGEQTKNKIFDDPEKIIYSIKRIIGKNFNDPNFNKLIHHLPYKNIISKSKNGRPIINVNFKGENRRYLPEEISSMILKRLKENAEEALNQKIKKVVITIPAYFTETQREATKIAAEGAGLEVLKIINEPTAAALAYGLRESNELKIADNDDDFFLFEENKPLNDSLRKKTILVFDLGGGTLDVTCAKITNKEEEKHFEILGHSGNTLLGGDDFDDILVNHCIKIFTKKYGVIINTTNQEHLKARKRLKDQCQKAKELLSYQEVVDIHINSLLNGYDLHVNLKRTEFENYCTEKFEEMIEPIKIALDCSYLDKEDIDEVILAGGSTRIPKIEEKIIEFFEEEKGKKKIKICKSINPDEVVAYGATLQAAISMKEINDIIINDITSHSLGICIFNRTSFDYFDKLIENGTNIPYEIKKKYTTHYDYQSSALIEIFEGENDFCCENKFLGKFLLKNITKAKAGIPKILVKLSIDENSIIHVTAKEEISGATKSLDISYSKGIMTKLEKTKMKNRLENEKDFDNKLIINKKERSLTEQKEILKQNFKETKPINIIKELEKVQEKLIEIYLENDGGNNLDKKYKNTKFLFRIYNYLFENYFDEYKEKTDEYLKKIKENMEIFKNEEAIYLKNLVLIFKDDKYDDRISQIVYYCIEFYDEYVQSLKEKNFASYYYDEALKLIENFREKIDNSKLKKDFQKMKKNCEFEKEIISLNYIDKNIEAKLEKRILTYDEAISAIDHYTYSIGFFGTIKEEASKKEKMMRAYFYTKHIDLILNYLKEMDLDNLYKELEAAESLLASCGNVTKNKDPWIDTLRKDRKIIEEKISENNEKKSKKMKDDLEKFKDLEIEGDNDEENILFFETVNKTISEKKDNINIRELYEKDPEEIIQRSLSDIQKLEGGELKNKVLNIINKIKEFFRRKKKKEKKKK